MTEESNLKLIIANGQNVVIQGLNAMLENVNWVVIVDIIKSGKDLVKKYFDHQPDLILSDVKLPDLNGLFAVQKLKEKDKNVKTLFISEFLSQEVFLECVRAGGLGLIGKDILKSELLFSLKTVYKGNYYYKGVMSFLFVQRNLLSTKEKTINSLSNSLPDLLLSRKEKEIFNHLGLGCTPDLICKYTDISRRTLNYHKKNIMQKLNISSTEELVAYAVVQKNGMKNI